MPSFAGNGYHDPKNEGLNHGSQRMLTPLVSTNSPAWPRNVICTSARIPAGRAGRRRALGWAVAYHCGTAARGARLAHVRRLRDGRRRARDLRPRLGRPSTATLGRRSSPTMPSTMRTRSRRRSSATTRSGHTCWSVPTTERDVEFTRRAPLGLRGHGPRGLARQLRARPRPARPGLAGFLTAEMAVGRRASRGFREWTLQAPRARAREEEDRWPEIIVRRRQRLRRAGAAQRARPGPARGPAALRLQGRDRRPDARRRTSSSCSPTTSTAPPRSRT